MWLALTVTTKGPRQHQTKGSSVIRIIGTKIQ